MQDITKYIKDLLIKNDNVILPSLGALYLNYQEARVESDKKNISPSRKQVFFNPSLSHDDGLLKSYIIENLSISSDEAGQIIRSFIENVKKELAGGKEFFLEEIGSLKYNSKGKICFSEDTSANLHLDSFGFDQIQITPLSSKANVECRDKQTNGSSGSKRKIIVWTSIAAVLFVLIAATYWMYRESYIKVDNLISFFQSPAIELPGEKFHKNIDENKEKDTIKSVDSSLQERSYDKEMENETAKVDAIIDKNVEAKNALLYQEPKGQKSIIKYYLIAGSFKRKDNAQYLKDELRTKGYNSELIETKGGWRVTFAVYTNKNVAERELIRIRKENTDSSVWLYAK
jgi:nucleoid DNA-binding protein